MSGDAILQRIGDALDLFNSGHRAEAREAFAAIWGEIGEEGDAFHACILSHYMADAQDDPLDELAWDRRALEAADRLARGNAGSPDGSLSVLSLYPSLHLNLADVLHRTGDDASARLQLELARTTVGALADDGYGQMIRGGIERLARTLADAG